MQAIVQAMLCRMPGIRQIAAQCGASLQTSNFSSLSHALRRQSGVKFLRSLIGRLETTSRYRKGELVAIDSMAVMFGKHRRHHCHKANNHAVGGGVLWSYQIAARAGTCPVRLVRWIHGAWNDAKLMEDVMLAPQGPVYLMDRGFYSIGLIGKWLAQNVRFIVRVKAGELQYDVVKELSPSRQLTKRWVLQRDVLVKLGSHVRKVRPTVRLIVAMSPTGEQFIYATSESDWSAQQVVNSYKKRWHIERFHRFLKNNIGLAHVYSFDANGLEFLTLAALLTAMLLVTTEADTTRSDTIKLLFAVLAAIRGQLGIEAPWKRNLLSIKRAQGRRRKRANK